MCLSDADSSGPAKSGPGARGLARRGVLITRQAEDAGPTADRVAALGFAPVLAPCLVIRRRAVTLPSDVQAVLVTSGNALAGLTPWPVPLLAVGDVTARRARAMGFAQVKSAGRDGAALVELAASLMDPGGLPLLLLSGSGQGGAVAAGLRAAGFRVIRRVVYAAVAPAALPADALSALRQDRLHAALFLSAETAQNFIRLLPPALAANLGNILALAIGKPAADALHALPWRQVRLARSPTLDDVLALL